jgi:hypothetical protein
VPANGFSMPTFDMPSLNYCAQAFTLGCESGTGLGVGTGWDGHAACPDADVSIAADTSDGSCNPPGQPCNTSAGGAGGNTLGDVDLTHGNGLCDPPGAQAEVDMRVHGRVWSDSTCHPATTPGCCVSSTYGDDVIGNGELLIGEADFLVSATTATATATFVDKNSDGCKRAGSGFFSPGPDGPKTLIGSPAPGPCCQVGQSATIVAAGVAFTGGSPLFDVGFTWSIPTTIAACGTAGAESCVLTTNPCFE